MLFPKTNTSFSKARSAHEQSRTERAFLNIGIFIRIMNRGDNKRRYNYMKTKRILSALMALLLMATLPITAFAEEYNIDEGSITVSADSSGQYVTQVGGVQNYQQTTETVITQTDSSTATTNTVTINAETGATVEVTLDGVNIDTSKTGEAAVSTSGAGNVTIELDDNSTIKSGSHHAGLEKNNTGELSITDVDNDKGSLSAAGGYCAAGIGGRFGTGGYDITISGGVITAIGGESAAGIGGGWNGYGNNITISGGNVTAISSSQGAGIGGGFIGNGNNITISGGVVTAIGGDSAAGIGGGWKGLGSNIKIWDEAQVNVQSGAGNQYAGAGAAIGNGGYKIGEDPIDGTAVEPNTSELTSDGKIEYYAADADMDCDRPNNIVVGKHVHTWDDGEVTKKATCVETGVMTYTCTAGNGFTKTEEIAATGKHNIVIDPAVEPTYTSTGLTEGSHCTTCDTMTIKQEIVPMLVKPAENESDDTQSAPLYRITDRYDKDIDYRTRQKDGVLTITVVEDFAVLTGTLSGISTLKAQGVEKIVFVTKNAISTFTLADLLEKGSSDEAYKLTHDAKTVTFTLGAKNTDVSDILEKA
jgi:hypothetical protein